MSAPIIDPNELSYIRQRFIGAQQSVPAFANWIANYALDDVRWLLGAIDGMRLGYHFLLDEKLDALFSEEIPDESDE